MSRAAFIVPVAAAAAGFAGLGWLVDSPVALGLASSLGLSLLVWPLTSWAKSGWSPNAPAGLEDLTSGHDSPGALMIGVLEAVVFYAAFLSAAWVLAGGWLVFKSASKWAAWQHIMKVPDTLTKNDDFNKEFLCFRRHWSSTLLTSFLFGTLCNIVVALVGACVARKFADLPLLPTACGCN